MSYYFPDKSPDYYQQEIASCQESNRQRWENIQNCLYDLDDCSVSMKSSDIMESVYSLLKSLSENGGKSCFWALADLEGNLIPARQIMTRYGKSCWMILDQNGQSTGEFAPWRPARPSTLAKRGYQEIEVERFACVTISASGSGLSGLASARAVVIQDFRDNSQLTPALVDKRKSQGTGKVND